jgi:hypothetical protein
MCSSMIFCVIIMFKKKKKTFDGNSLLSEIVIDIIGIKIFEWISLIIL